MGQLIVGDVRDALELLPSASVQCCVTSPPYFGLRDYGNAGQIGLEATPAAYVSALVAVFRDVRRVLKDDGVLWLNLGDSYASKWACSRRNIVGSGSLENGKRDGGRGPPQRSKRDAIMHTPEARAHFAHTVEQRTERCVKAWLERPGTRTLLSAYDHLVGTSNDSPANAGGDPATCERPLETAAPQAPQRQP